MMMENHDKHDLGINGWVSHGHSPLLGQQSVQLQSGGHHCTVPVNDEVRFSIIAAVSQKPGIWDSQREKTSGPSRKELFTEVAREINEQHRIELLTEDVEKQWKNLKDTYIKTRKKLTFNNDGVIIPPKWKFYNSLNFLEHLFRGQIQKRRYEEDDPLSLVQAAMTTVHSDKSSQSCAFQPTGVLPAPLKRMREDELDEEDEYMGFCRSLVWPMREIALQNRIEYLKLQKAIRDMIHESQMNMIMNGHIR